MRNILFVFLVALLIVLINGAILPVSADSKKKIQITRIPIKKVQPAIKSTKSVRPPANPSKKIMPGENSLKSYYDNKEIFQKLSGAAQSALERIYGPKRQTELPNSAPVNQKKLVNAPDDQPVNVLVNDPNADTTAQNTQSETSIVLGSTSNNVIVGFNDSGSCTNFCADAQHFTGWSYSTDMGASFTDGGALPDDVFPFGDVGDPVLARDNTNNIIHFVTLGQDFSTGNGPSLKCFRSTDDGVSWSSPLDCTPGMPIDDFQDKPWLTVDNFAGTGQGNAYIAWRQFSLSDPQGIRFVRSTDNGATWEPSGGTLIADQGAFNVQGAFVAVGPDHAVYVFWIDQSAGFGTPHILRGRKSTDLGVTWGPPADMYTYTGTNVNGSLNLSGGFRSNGFPHALIEPAGTFENEVDVTFADFDPVDGDPDIFWTSCGGGDITNCQTVQVNTDTGTAEQYMPTLATTNDGENLLFTWYDYRNDPFFIERWAQDWIGSSPTPDFRVNDDPFPPIFGSDPVVNPVYMGDYDQAVADDNFFYLSFLDTTLGSQDVVFAKVPRDGPGAGILGAGRAIVSGGNGNGQIDFNECNDLTIPLHNDGTADVTGISAVLSTSTPNVTITQPNSTYPDLTPGSSANNDTLFEVSTSPSFVCGTDIELTLTVTSSAGTDVLKITIDTSGNYQLTTSTGQAIDPGTDDIGNHGDDVITNIALPFPYQVYGHTFNSVNVSSNGNLQFLSANAQFENGCLPAASMNYIVAPHWDDLCTSEVAADCGDAGMAGNGVFTSTAGSAPNRIFNIEWRATYFGNPVPVNFEARLYEGQQRVDFVYGTVTDAGNGATIGLQKGIGPKADQYGCNDGGISSGLQVSAELLPCQDGGGQCAGVCTYSNDFNSAGLTWIEEKPIVTQPGDGFLHLTPLKKKAIGVADPSFAGASTGTFTFDIQFSGGPDAKSWIYTHRTDKKNTMEVLFKEEQDRVVVKEKRPVGVVSKAKANFTLNPNTNYHVVIVYNGTTYDVTIDGTPVITGYAPFASLPVENIGAGSKNNTTLLDNVCVIVN
jgi:hypothetical protein